MLIAIITEKLKNVNFIRLIPNTSLKMISDLKIFKFVNNEADKF